VQLPIKTKTKNISLVSLSLSLSLHFYFLIFFDLFYNCNKVEKGRKGNSPKGIRTEQKEAADGGVVRLSAMSTKFEIKNTKNK
jgi:hypothetical protein